MKYTAIDTLPPVGKQKRYSRQVLTYIHALEEKSAAWSRADRLKAGDQLAGRRFLRGGRKAQLVRPALEGGGVPQGHGVRLPC
ncbi:hypothetical protein MESS4_20055 [Mesorhizobium sp. STM 4661]|nr:hypothetical protein MESS4_20055 [Mesorhizobium sp. STM 4661]